MVIKNPLDLNEITLLKGGHSKNDEQQWCLLEAAAYMAGEPWSGHPQCVSPIIAAFGRQWNDSLNDEDRQMLVPLLPKMIGTATTPDDEQARFWLIIDWLIRVYTPAWLSLVERCKASGEKLRRLPPVNIKNLETAKTVISEAQTEAAAAGAAAWDAARAAGRQALQPTVKELQASAVQLMERLCEVVGGGAMSFPNSCIICRHDETNPASNQGHKIDNGGYCVVCREKSDHMKAEISKRIAAKKREAAQGAAR